MGQIGKEYPAVHVLAPKPAEAPQPVTSVPESAPVPEPVLV